MGERDGQGATRGASRRVWIPLLAAWTLLGCALVASVWTRERAAWIATTAAPWGIGAACLLTRRLAARVVVHGREALATTGARTAATALVGLVLVVGWAFGVAAGLLLATWCGALGLTLTAAGRAVVAGSLLRRTAILGVALVLAAAAAESVLRIPSVAGRLGLPSEEARWTNRYDRLETRNALGLRTAHDLSRRHPGVGRVLALGDSFTWGEHLASSEDTWPGQLERILRTQSGGGEVEVVNMGQRGFTTVNEAEAMGRLGWALDPDLVVVQWLVNDVYPSGPAFQRVENWHRPHRLLPDSLRSGAVADSDLLAFLEKRYAAWRMGDWWRDYPSLYADANPAWRANVAAFDEIGAAARARGVPVVLMIWPMVIEETWPAERHPHRDIHAMVASVARRAGFRVLDLTPAFGERGRDGLQWWATPYDRHPNAKANALVAQTLNRYLADEHIAVSVRAVTSGR